MNVLDTALAYAHKGLRVIPIKQGGKYPPIEGWQNAATSDPTQIRQWFTGAFKDCGLGIATGKFSEKLSHRTTNLFVATYIRELFAARKKAR
jgi:hypothetical protein